VDSLLSDLYNGCMRDIVGPHASHAHSEHLALPHSTPPTFLERLISRINQLAGVVSPEKPGVVTPVLSTTLPVNPRRTTAIRKRRVPRGVATKTGKAIKRAAQVTGEEIKKPGRKTAVLHTVALGALFAIVLHGLPSWQQNTVATSDASTTSATRRYLPSIANDPKLEPLSASTALVQTGKQVSLYGWITPWNANAGTTDLYNSASAFWLTLSADGYTVTPKSDWSMWESYTQKHTLSETYLTVSGDPDDTYKALSDLDIQSKHINALLTAVKDHGFNGIDIDYEGLGSGNRELFTGFIRNLSNIFHQAGKKVAVTVEARIANQVPMDWRALGELSDEVRIMAYDYHSHSTNQPGPISPVAWVAEIVAYATDHIAPSKLVIGLGNYGYDWIAPLTTDDTWEGIGISYDQAISLSTTNSATVIHQTGIDDRGYDIGTIPSFTYTDTQGREHQVWFEDAASLQEKVNAVAGYQIKGIMFWNVGAGDPALWQPHA
jgi:spore germination protein YaaH